MSTENKTLNCIVVKGLGEGAYFMSMKHYQNEIKKNLGFDAYTGTLNLKANEAQLDILKKITPIRISGFKLGNKHFGGANCYKAKIKNIDGAIIIPDINKHKKDIIEFIAPVHVKSKLRIKEGDEVLVELL